MTIQKTIRKTVIIGMLLLSNILGFAQDTANVIKFEKIGKSENLTQCHLFSNDVCNVFLFTENNIICSLGGETDSLPYLTRASQVGKCKTVLLAGNTLIVQREKEIVSFAQDMGSISQTVQVKQLYKYGKRDVKAFKSNSSGFFIVECYTDKKTNETKSTVSYFHIAYNKARPILEAKGRINCIYGDTAAMCFGLDSNLVVVANGKIAVLTSEKEDIIAVAPSTTGIFYSTPTTTNFIVDQNRQMCIFKQGAQQLIDNCNTLYMILNDGTLLRVLNTATFSELQFTTKQ